MAEVELIKVFFGKVDNDGLLKSQNLNRGFWEFEEDFDSLGTPIAWGHGVFQYFSISQSESWYTLTGHFSKIYSENFTAVKSLLVEIHDDFDTLADLIELITVNGGDLFDIRDEFHQGCSLIEEESGIDFKTINLSNFGKDNLTSENSIWIFEVQKFEDVRFEILDNQLNVKYESSDELNLEDKFTFAIVIKKK